MIKSPRRPRSPRNLGEDLGATFLAKMVTLSIDIPINPAHIRYVRKNWAELFTMFMFCFLTILTVFEGEGTSTHGIACSWPFVHASQSHAFMWAVIVHAGPWMGPVPAQRQALLATALSDPLPHDCPQPGPPDNMYASKLEPFTRALPLWVHLLMSGVHHLPVLLQQLHCYLA